MTYASDLGLKVGSKIKVLGVGNSHACFSVGDTIELVKDDGTLSPWFKRIGDSLDQSPFSIRTHTWQHYKEEEKDMTPFEQAGYTKDTKFKVLVDDYDLEIGTVVVIRTDDGTDCPFFKTIVPQDHGSLCYYLPNARTGCEQLELLVEILAPKIKFPCCVPTSEIKDANTLLALVAVFEANGATVYDGVDCGGGHEFDRVDNWDYFGVSLRASSAPFRTDFYDDFEDYNQSEESSELTVYHVSNLLGSTPSIASQEAITERLEDSLGVGIDLSKEASSSTTEPLVSIVKDVTYHVSIKGTLFTFTQDEINELTEELLGFSDDF